MSAEKDDVEYFINEAEIYLKVEESGPTENAELIGITIELSGNDKQKDAKKYKTIKPKQGQKIGKIIFNPDNTFEIIEY